MLATLSTTAGTALRESRTASSVSSPRSSRQRVATTSRAVAGLSGVGDERRIHEDPDDRTGDPRREPRDTTGQARGTPARTERDVDGTATCR